MEQVVGCGRRLCCNEEIRHVVYYAFRHFDDSAVATIDLHNGAVITASFWCNKEIKQVFDYALQHFADSVLASKYLHNGAICPGWVADGATCTRVG